MEKEEFDKLSVDHKLEYIKIFVGNFTDSVRRRMEILPSVSALAAMLLIIATFGDKIIPFNSTIKFLLSLLLLVIPFSLYFYNFDLKDAQKKNLEYTDKLLGIDSKKEIDKGPAMHKFIAFFPDIVIYILFVIILLIIGFIWFPAQLQFFLI